MVQRLEIRIYYVQCTHHILMVLELHHQGCSILIIRYYSALTFSIDSAAIQDVAIQAYLVSEHMHTTLAQMFSRLAFVVLLHQSTNMHDTDIM